MNGGLAERQRRYRFGHVAETACVWLLRLKRYRILARRHRNAAGEIDIVAQRGHLVTFMEVKARGHLELARESLSHAQRRRIRRAAEVFLQNNPQLQSLDCRFDAMLVAPGRLPYHEIDAWRD